MSEKLINHDSFSFASIASKNFDSHIENSVPGFSNLNDMIVQLSTYFVESFTQVEDYGCSTGKLIEQIYLQNKKYKKDVYYTGYEIEDAMEELASKRFDILVKQNKEDEFKFNLYSNVEDIIDESFYKESISFATSIFTLQFIQETKRQKIINAVYERLAPGAAFIIAEKLYSPTAKLQNMMTFPHYDYKLKSFNEKEILDKERSLRYMLKSNTEIELLDMLGKAGFKNKQCFWRNYNFAAYICIK